MGKPTLRGTDHAIRRRIKLIPFLATVADADAIKDMPERLAAEYPGILAWCVRGLLAWRKAGRLITPKTVDEATNAYIDEQDVLGRFIEERCTLLPDVRTKRALLYRAYLEWAKISGEKDPMSQTAFGYAIANRGIRSLKTSGEWFYVGIGVNSTAELF